MTEEEKKAEEKKQAETARREEFTSIANSAASSHVKRQAKQVNDQLAVIMAKLEELSAPAESAEPATSEPANEEDAKVKALQARLKEMDKAVAQRESQLAEQELQRKTNTARGILKDSLSEAGVPADRVKQAVGYLFDSEKRVQYSESGAIEFLIPEEGYVDRLNVKDGVQKFLSGPEGKMYLPPRDVSGSGNQGGKSPRARASSNEGELESLSESDLLKALGQAMIDG